MIYHKFKNKLIFLEIKILIYSKFNFTEQPFSNLI